MSEDRYIVNWKQTNQALAYGVPIFSLLTILGLLTVFRVFTIPQQINSDLPVPGSSRQVTFYYESIVQNGFANGLLLFYLLKFVTWLQSLLPLRPDPDTSIFKRDSWIGADYYYPRSKYDLSRLAAETSLFAGATIFIGVVIGFIGNVLLYFESFEAVSDILFVDIIVRSILELIPGVKTVIQNSVGNISNAGVGLRLYFILTYLLPIAFGYLTMRSGATAVEAMYNRSLRRLQLFLLCSQRGVCHLHQFQEVISLGKQAPKMKPLAYFVLGLLLFLIGPFGALVVVFIISDYPALLFFALGPFIYALIWWRL